MNREEELKKFDSKSELKRLSIDRLFVLQKNIIKNIEHYIVRTDLYDKNDVFNCIEELLIINSIIKLKIENNKKMYK